MLRPEIFPSKLNHWCCRMRKKYECLIEVKIVYGSERWEEFVSSKMVETITKLRATVEELGGKVHIRH